MGLWSVEGGRAPARFARDLWCCAVRPGQRTRKGTEARRAYQTAEACLGRRMKWYDGQTRTKKVCGIAVVAVTLSVEVGGVNCVVFRRGQCCSQKKK